MYNKLFIIGAGGQGKVVLDIALKNGYEDIYFVDDCIQGDCMGFSIVSTTSELEKLDDGKSDFVIAVGNNKIRKEIADTYSVNYVSLIHPSAQIGLGTNIGLGTVVMAGAVISPESQIGSHCIINSNAVVEHENILGDYVHISPCVALGGNVTVGANTHIGIGSTVKNNIKICKNCIIGAGAIVVKDIEEGGIYIGTPAVKQRI